MTIIRSLLNRDLDLRIKDVIQVGQDDEDVVHAELTEYIATDSIKRHYRRLLQGIAESKSEPTENIGVWISGFFGSGKSSFAKNLGYALQNPKIRGDFASELFKQQVDDTRVSQTLDVINSQIPIHVIMFDVSASNTIRTPDESIAHIMYRQLLSQLDYASDYEIAELEIDLEAEGKLETFRQLCEEQYDRSWESVRKGMQRYSRASAILHLMDAKTYPSADSWSTTIKNRETDLTVEQFVHRAFTLSERRRPGKAMVFIIDEVGRYVAHSNDKLEILRAVVEQFGKIGRNLALKNQITAPAWIIVTSQEKLDEVVDAIDKTRIDLPHVQDRFTWDIDLEPSDIREVATRRVLAKTEQGKATLRELYREHEGVLKDACHLEQSSAEALITEDDFVQFYPYMPHYIEMSIDIMSGIRLQPGAPPHLGGSNRTIIKQVYEMLVTVGIADDPVGTLVTLDRIYELVSSNLSDERRKDMDRLQQEFGNGKPIILRVARALALLEFVTKTPKTIRNISALLVGKVGEPAPTQDVEFALGQLADRGYVRETENGWKLQTAQERTWQTERREHSPRMGDRQQILRDATEQLFSEAQLLTTRYKNLRTFRIGVALDGRTISDEQLMLRIFSAATPKDFAGKVDEVIAESRKNETTPYWVFAVNQEIDKLVAEIHASNRMIATYGRKRGQNQISAEQHANLDHERNLKSMYETRLREELKNALISGSSVFDGVKRDGVHYGNSVDSIIKGFLREKIPVIYPNLEIGARALPSKAPEQILKATNLKGLPNVFYERDDGLALIVQEGADYKLYPEAEVAQEIYQHLTHYDEYGENEQLTGKAVETKYTGYGYGWETDLLQLVLAFLFRAGMINVSYKGMIYKDYRNDGSWKVFSGVRDFRQARFIPKKPIERRDRVGAAMVYEKLTGQQVDLQPQDISEALKVFAEGEKNTVLQIKYRAQTNRLPFIETLTDYNEILQNILTNSPEDNIYLLVNQGDEIIERKEQVEDIWHEAVTDERLAYLEYMRRVVNQMWPEVREQVDGEVAEAVQYIEETLTTETYYLHFDELINCANQVAEVYYNRYETLHQQRGELFAEAIADIQETDAWHQISEEQQEQFIRPLQQKAVPEVTIDYSRGELVSQNTHSTIGELESDIDAINQKKVNVLECLQRAIAPEETIERVQLTRFFPGTIETEEDIEQAINTLHERLRELVAKGVKVIVE